MKPNTYGFIKGCLDRLFAFIFIIIFTPFLLILSLLIYFNLGFPILFIQKRPGLNAKTFSLIKFRTMKIDFDENGNFKKDELRQSKFGNWLRKTSFDELPELINILKGDMSFVGPRPLLIEYLKFYNKKHQKRHLVKPGISGLAQINGRNSIDWETKLDFDVYYVENRSFLLDINIFLKTFKVLIKQKGINFKKNFSMPPFRGLD